MEYIPEIKKRKHFRTPSIIVLLVICVIGIATYSIFSAPGINTFDTIVHVRKGETLTTLLTDLEEKHVIRDSTVIKFMVRFFGAQTIARGDYKFSPNQNAVSVAWQIAKQEHKVQSLRITLKEGMTNIDMANALSVVDNFDKSTFLAETTSKQGYLFPDTYFFFPLASTDEIIETLSSNFNSKIATLRETISVSGRTEDEIVTMASIIEKEANGKEDARIISGILWKRLDRGMLLQVDASPDTYKQKGLPMHPIANPGLASLSASVNPVESPYFFYLHDKNGMVHFAKDYNEHLRNIKLYLK